MARRLDGLIEEKLNYKKQANIIILIVFFGYVVMRNIVLNNIIN